MDRAGDVTTKLSELPVAGIPMEEAEGLIQESREVRVVTKAMEEFEHEWERSVVLA